MMRQRLESDHDLSEVVDDAHQADGGQGQERQEDERIAEHPFPRWRPSSDLEVVTPGKK